MCFCHVERNEVESKHLQTNRDSCDGRVIAGQKQAVDSGHLVKIVRQCRLFQHDSLSTTTAQNDK